MKIRCDVIHRKIWSDNLTRAGRDRHCKTCRARGRTRGWPVNRSSRSSRWKKPPPSRAILAQLLIARRLASSNTMTCKHKIFRTLPNLLVRSSHLEEESQRQKSSENNIRILDSHTTRLTCSCYHKK